MIITNILLAIAIILIAGFKRFYFPEYLKKKGENLATKEDIEEITKKVEAVKAEIGSQLYIHQTRYQNEFEILKELTEKTVELRDAALSLRPPLDYFDTGEPKEERKQRRLKRYSDAASAFYKLSENRKPFYPEELYTAIKKLDQKIWEEAAEYSWDEKEARDPKYWEKAKKNVQEISKMADEVVNLIRNRTKYWEKFDIESLK